MSDDAPVDPFEVPVFTGDLDLLETKVKALSHGGPKVETAGSDVHKSFGGLSAFYKAPEAEQLFGVTKPVADKAREVGHDMSVIAGALGTYAREVRPLVKQLQQLKQDAADFRHKVDSSDDDWREDGDLTDENLARRNKIAEVWAAFQAAERDCHAKIVGLVGGKALHAIDASHPTGYGYDAETLKQSKSLPWGEAVEESVPWWKVWRHAYDFGKGVFIDGAWGSIKGLLTLFGWEGSEAAGQAWLGLAKLTTTTSLILAMPGLAAPYLMTPGHMMPSWFRDSRTAMLETGKAFVAWDQWESNGSRAAGAVTFNAITAIITRGGGAAVEGASKAGVAIRAVSMAGKVGEVIDPMTYVFKGAGAGISKIGDVMAHLKNAGHLQVPKISEGAYSLPEGAAKLADGTVQLPKGTAVPDGATKLPHDRIRLPEDTVTLPPNTVKDPFTGKYTSGRGDLYNEDGSLFQKAEDAPKGQTTTPATGVDNPRTETPARQEQPVLAGVGGRGDDITRVGSEISDPGRVGENVGHGSTSSGANTLTGRAGDHGTPGGSAGNRMPTSSHTPGGDGSTHHTPGTGGLDNSRGGAGHATEAGGAGTGGHGSSDGPSVPHQGDGPVGAGGVDDLGHAGHDAIGDGSVPHEPESPILPGGSEPRPDGARYVEEPAPEDVQAARFYDEIRANPNSLDIGSISENTGVSTQVLDRVRTHFFLTKHVVALAPGDVRLAYFTPRSDLAEIWQAASQRSLSPQEAMKFERYIAHEYVESHLIEAGIPYLRDEPHLWQYFRNESESGYYRDWPKRPNDAGAHELAANENRGGFNHWRGLGLEVPKVELAPNLSNIDEVMAALFQELRSKGIELK
ncbi:hypothetical protein [Streptomyces sp. CT34]|uniref:hypothetical protein n=1 Tax=Streptomyces sp. CT34 TaxID=1553907 RepID=UPI00068A4615|nr:hypothetical protein [Streptomyces sp. CT34]